MNNVFVMLHAEDIESSLSDYQKALSLLEQLVEPDSRLIAELYPSKFKILLRFRSQWP